MRTLTLHEKKLTLLLLAALAAGVHLLGIKFALGWDRENRRRLAGVKEELEEARFWISQQEEWRSRAEWLEKNFRPVPAENPAPALQHFLQGSRWRNSARRRPNRGQGLSSTPTK